VIAHSYGGYSSPKALKICVIIGVLANCAALPIPFIDEFFYIKFLLWSLLFFGGFVLPIATGIML
jgi:hypothetical protein